jgi:hypothetical protein
MFVRHSPMMKMRRGTVNGEKKEPLRASIFCAHYSSLRELRLAWNPDAGPNEIQRGLSFG